MGAAKGAERGGDAATAAAEAGGLLLAGAEAVAAGEARDWWSRGQSEGPGLKKCWLRGRGAEAVRPPDGWRWLLGPGPRPAPCGVGGWRGWEDVRPECRMTRGRGRATNLGSGTDGGNPCVMRGLCDPSTPVSPESVHAGLSLRTPGKTEIPARRKPL